jgi:hypothetical protein
VLFRIAGDSDAEIRGVRILQIGIEVTTAIHIRYLVEQIDGKTVPICFSFESTLASDGVAAQDQDIFNAHEVQINQRIFRLFLGKAAADNVGHRIEVVFVADGCTNPDGTWTLPYGALLKQTTLNFTINVFFSMVRDVHKRRVEFHQFLNGLIDLMDIFPLEGWEQFEAEQRCFRLGQMLSDFHGAFRECVQDSKRFEASQRLAVFSSSWRRAAQALN